MKDRTGLTVSFPIIDNTACTVHINLLTTTADTVSNGEVTMTGQEIVKSESSRSNTVFTNIIFGHRAESRTVAVTDNDVAIGSQFKPVHGFGILIIEQFAFVIQHLCVKTCINSVRYSVTGRIDDQLTVSTAEHIAIETVGIFNSNTSGRDRTISGRISLEGQTVRVIAAAGKNSICIDRKCLFNRKIGVSDSADIVGSGSIKSQILIPSIEDGIFAV